MPRTKKNSNKPKGKTTAYAFFVQSEREAMRIRNRESGREDNPSFTELSKFCSEKWKCLDEEKRAPFYELAREDKARYNEEMASYVPSEDVVGDTPKNEPKKSRKRKRQADENHPKRNKSAYLFFCEAERPNVKETQPELSMTETSKILGRLWAEIGSERKQIFTEMANDDRKRYAREMETYRQMSEDGPSLKKQK